MNELGPRTTTQDKEELEARKELEEMIHKHRALKKVIILINGEILETEIAIWNHANWMGLKGWVVDIKRTWRSGE
jgi:hypothetical protein